jgi:hypothetical protein
MSQNRIRNDVFVYQFIDFFHYSLVTVTQHIFEEISSAEFSKVANRLFRKIKLSTVLDTFLKDLQKSFSKFLKF